MTQKQVAEKVLDYYKSRGGRLFANDQDAINAAVPEEIAELSPRYNYSNIFWHYSYHTLVKISRPAPYLTQEIVEEAGKDPCIIHYLGEERPWRRGNRHKYREDYRKYLSLTPWKNTPEETGWEIYFRFYGAFWKILKPFPMMQYHMIDALIPFVLNRRKTARLKREEIKK